MYKNNTNRHGVTLLFVLAMMVMFAMLVTSFMVIVAHNRRIAEMYASHHVEAPPAGQFQTLMQVSDLDEAFQVLLTVGLGTGKHSILEDLYGSNSGLEVVPDNITVETIDGIIFIQVTVPDLSTALGSDQLGNVVTVDFTKEHRKKFPESNYLHHKSTFIYDVYPATETVLLVPFKCNLPLDEQVTELRCMTSPSRLVFNTPQSHGSSSTSLYTPFLSLYADHADNGMPQTIIPSFHRKDAPLDLRPSPSEHPDFTGSNPAAKNWDHFIEYGPLDVDNDGNGIADGVWLDILSSARFDMHTLSYYKPLVSYLVVDMDGRLNVNAVGNLARTSSSDTGTGMGPAELYSALVNTEMLTGDGGYHGRYGDSTGPSGDIIDFINETAYASGGLRADWFGTSPITFDNLGNREVADAPNHTDDVAPPIPYRNPYGMNPYTNRDNLDNPFTAEDLESLLRSVIDTDYDGLAQRFRELLDGDSFDAATFASTEHRYNLGTRSSNIPAAPPIYSSLPAADRDALWELLPQEVRRGEKVDLNRLTLHPDWITGGNDMLVEKARFAQEIFYLLQVMSRPINNADRERLAQWSVNLVDFIDPDDVMTPFIFSISDAGGIIVKDNTDLIADLLNTPETFELPPDRMLIWGFEKPEVAITETLALHNRGVAGRPNDTTDFRQAIEPQGSLFVELQRQGNPHRNLEASHLVESGGTLNLAKKMHADGPFLWRIAIGEATKTESGKFNWDDDDHAEKNALRQLLAPSDGKEIYPQFYQQASASSGDGHYHPDLGAPERFIWFGSEADSDYLTADLDIRRRSYFRSDGAAPVLEIDATFVIAPRLVTNFAPGESISLPAEKTMVAAGPEAVTGRTPATKTAGVNISEPLPTVNNSQLRDGYWGNVSLGSAGNAPEAFDGRLSNTIPRQRGTVPCYKTICLQRLADPTRPHHAICNPYITVDWSMIDLQVFNSVDRNELGLNQNQLTEEPEGAAGIAREPEFKYFSSRQWKQTVSGFANLWDRTLESSVLTPNSGKAGLEECEYTVNPDGLAERAPLHTLGESNWGESLPPFLHFPWHDAPLMNSGEFMLVPASAPGRFGVEFHDNGTGKDFFGSSPRYSFKDIGLYLDWKNEYNEFFDYAHVPSRFAGTRWEKTPIVYPIVYREPGKLNVNTLTQEGWNALKSDRSNFPDYDDFDGKRPLSDADWTEYRLTELIDDDADNPYTALENAMRLSDVTTTRSNVFAIWITLGYFECDEDGNNLGAERGLADGTVRRYRAFYLIDRSIPVGFRRGEELNSKDVVILKTLLE